MKVLIKNIGSFLVSNDIHPESGDNDRLTNKISELTNETVISWSYYNEITELEIELPNGTDITKLSQMGEVNIIDN